MTGTVKALKTGQTQTHWSHQSIQYNQQCGLEFILNKGSAHFNLTWNKKAKCLKFPQVILDISGQQRQLFEDKHPEIL